MFTLPKGEWPTVGSLVHPLCSNHYGTSSVLLIKNHFSRCRLKYQTQYKVLQNFTNTKMTVLKELLFYYYNVLCLTLPPEAWDLMVGTLI